MTDPTAAFAKLVPGFDFLQGLVKNAGSALPGMGSWVAPTLDPAELDKRIEELRTVQFWLEQNARMMATTIQALEVQRMTLSTLKTMNLSLGDLGESLKIRLPTSPIASANAASAPAEPAPAAAPARRAAKPKSRSAKATVPGLGVPAGVVDPMQWWGALTKQFAELAANAVKDSATDAARNLAGAMVKQGMDAAGETIKKAAAVPGAMAQTAASAAQTMAKAAGKAAGTAAGVAGAAAGAAARGATGAGRSTGAGTARRAPARKRS